MVENVTKVVVATYDARKRELETRALDAAASRRPLMAGLYRAAARTLGRAIVAEITCPPSEGLGTWEKL